MSKKWNGRSAIVLAIAALIGTGLLYSCGSKPTNTADGVSNGDPSALSTAMEKDDSGQNSKTTFLQIEPTILKVTQNATYFYGDGELSFTIDADTVKFPSDDVSSIFTPKVNFMPSSIFVSQNKIAVVRMPDDDSIIITYSNDNGKTWRDSDAIHSGQLADYATAKETLRSKDTSLLSLYVNFPSKATGFLVIGFGTTMGTQYTRALFKTIDGGMSWNPIDSNITTPDTPITGIYFADEMNGFIVQSHINVSAVEVRRTTDGGANWSASAITMPLGLPDDGTELLTAFAPYYASNQWVLPAFEQPDKLIYFTSRDQGVTWDYNSTMDIEIDPFLLSNT